MWSSRGRRMFPWYAEAAMLVGGYLAFGLIRAAVDGGASAATHLATVVQALERKIGIAVEYPLNHAMLPHPVLVYLTGYFYRLCLLAVPVILIWLWVRRPELYGRRRTVLVITTLIDLPLVRLFPESPPRFAQDGIIDYIATRNILGGASMAAPHSGVNLLAAMPSMHIAWTTWCAYAVCQPRIVAVREALGRSGCSPRARLLSSLPPGSTTSWTSSPGLPWLRLRPG